MVAARIISYGEMLARLATYKCERITQYPSGLEVWETGWKEPFTLWAENGSYSELQYFRLIGGLIAQTMPVGWNGAT
jgi:hypothetical protein